MRQSDLAPFSDLLDAIWGLKGAPAPTGVQKAMFFRALAAHPLEEVRAGLDAHLRDPKRGQFLPMPADVIAQIQGIVAGDGRPGVEEAWATAFRAIDEAATVVWTAEMAEAFGIARPLVLAGDEVAGRMAFKEAYSRLVARAREDRVAPSWSATLGHDAEARNAALLPHVQAGRVSADLLLDAPKGLDDVLALPAPAGASASNLAARALARAKLAEIRAEQASRKVRRTPFQIDRQRTAALKADAAAKTTDYLAAATALSPARDDSETAMMVEGRAARPESWLRQASMQERESKKATGRVAHD